MSNGPEWFAPKRYGYGAGLPISWQGWVLFIGYLVLVTGASVLIPRTIVGYVSIVTILTVAFIVIVSRTTQGGPWRWRSGKDD
jgi:hypothetical protein